MNQLTKATTLFQKLIRLENADDLGYCICATCSRRVHFTQCDAGHYIPRAYRKHLLNRDNVVPQCVSCNRLNDGKPVQFRAYLVSKLGESAVCEMEETKYQSVRYTRSELANLCAEYRAAIRVQERRLNLR